MPICKEMTARCRLLAAILLMVGALSGCVVQKMGTDLAYSVKGDYYLKAEDPHRGADYFREEVKTNPESPRANYYYGRMLLRSDKPATALPYLLKASRLEPENADYQFWTGVAHGLLHQDRQERASYEKTLKIDPNHLQALTGLGNYYLKNRQYGAALKMYDRALAIWPENQTALYNRGLVLAKLGKRQEEQRAWHRYLAVSPTGGLARNAVDHLNGLGDFSYRNYYLGPRVVTVRKIRFVGSGAEPVKEDLPTLKMIADTASDMKTGVLQVVVYQKGDVRLAKARALRIRKILLAEAPELGKGRIGISWFGKSQRDTKKKWNIEESVDFFLVNQ